MLKGLLIFLQQEIRATLHESFSWLTPLLFFVIIVCMFPIGLGTDSRLLTQAAPGIIWITALLAILISIGNLFQQDAKEGFLELLLLSPYPLTLLMICKIFSHWLTHCLPLVLISPLLGFLLGLTTYEILVLFITLLLGTPVLSLLGAIGASLLIGLRGNNMLLPILIVPLYIPVLIFGSGAIMTAHAGQPVNACLAMMGALLLTSVTFAPPLSGMALRIGVNQ